MSVENAIKWRKTVKVYQPSNDINHNDLDKIIDAGLLAPSSVGLEPTTAIIITNKEIRKEIAEYAYPSMNVPKVVDSQALIILVGIKPEYFKKNDFEFVESRISKWRWEGNTAERENIIARYKNSFRSKTDHQLLMWTREQAHITLSFMILQASELKYGSTIMGGYNQEKLDEWLIKNKYIDEDKHTNVITFAIGQYDENEYMSTLPRSRMSKDEFAKVIK